MKKCVYAGSFDPLTNGHLWMIREGAQLLDMLIVAIGVNPAKQYTFSLEKRLEMLRQALADLPHVQVDAFSMHYLADYARQVSARYILRGVRSESDYEYERGMRYINQDLAPELTSIFLIPPRELIEISSSMVKGLSWPIGWDNVVRQYVPPGVYREILDQKLASAFARLWNELKGSHAEVVYRDLAARYAEPQRHYHTLAHIAACLAEAARFELEPRTRQIVELAIWFHDAIYDPTAHDNEARSSALFRAHAAASKLDSDMIDDVTRLIEATCTHESGVGDDERALQVFLDIDLSILGASAERFHAYEQDIGQEYAHVSLPLYRSMRAQVLRKFLARERIFKTAELSKIYEAQARSNLENSIRALEQSQ